MSDMINSAVAAVAEKLGDSFDSSAKFVIEDEGAITADADGVRAADDDADVTLSADSETFKAIIDGDMDPTSAFMQGRLKVDGDMGAAMKLGSALA